MKVVFILLAALAFPAHAAVFKWVDINGSVQYSDTPPPPGARKVEEKKIVPSTIDTEGMPFAVQEAAKRNPVTLWVSDCGELCTRARDYLAKRGVPHTMRNPMREGEQEAWKAASGGDHKYPLLMIGAERVLVGFNEDQWNAALDAAGYPRSAPSIKPQSFPLADPQAGLKPPPSDTGQTSAPANENK